MPYTLQPTLSPKPLALHHPALCTVTPPPLLLHPVSQEGDQDVLALMHERGLGAKLSNSKDRWMGFKIKFLSYFSNMLRDKLKVRRPGGQS